MIEEQQSKPRQYSHLDQSYYQIDEYGIKARKQTDKQIKCLKKDKEYFIKQLLASLGYQSSLRTFTQQCKTALHDKNPEQASNKKKIVNNKKKEINQNQLKDIIQNSPDYDSMIESFEKLYAENQIDEQQTNQKKNARKIYERKMKQLYSEKKQAIIPKYKNIQIKFVGKQVKFIDVNENEDICLLDSEDLLHVISTNTQIKPFKVENAREIIYLKWINKSTIFLINSIGKVTVFACLQDELKEKTKIALKLPKIKKICGLVMKYPEFPHKEYVRILLKNEHSQFIVCQIVVEMDTIKLSGGTLIQSLHEFKSFNLLKIPKIDKEGKCIQEIEHYYGLTQNCKNIVKFDTIVKKQGIIWTSNKKIDSWANTNCRYFLIILITQIKQEKRLVNNQKKSYKSFQYQFLKMNGHGSIIQRIPIDFASPLLLDKFAMNPTPIQISRVKLMDPQWLTCFDWDENIIYISLRTGKILHIQDLQIDDLQVIGVGKTNCIVYKSEDKIFLISTVFSEKKKVLLEKKRPIRDRQSLILRLTRNGIPETLLQLLQQLRHNQIQH